MKTKNLHHFFSFNSLCVYALIFVIAFGESVMAQSSVVVFKDEFSISNNYNTTFTSGSPSVSYTRYRATFDESSNPTSNVEGGRFRLVSPNSPGSGWVYVMGALSGYNTPFNSTLSNLNSDSISWSLNLRFTFNTTMDGFGESQNGFATILMADGNDMTTASGYAVVYGDVDFGQRLRIVRFDNGLDSNSKLTNIASSSRTMDEFVGGTQYNGIKVVYIPATNTWNLYFRVEGSTYVDPDVDDTGLNLLASGVDSELVETEMTHFGFLFNYLMTTTNTRYIFHDNYSVRVYDKTTGNQTSIQQNPYRVYNEAGSITVEADKADVTIYSLSGATIEKLHVTGRANINNVSKGMYIIKIKNPKGESFAEKIIVN